MRAMLRTGIVGAAIAVAMTGLVGCESSPLGVQGFEAQVDRSGDLTVENFRQAAEEAERRRAGLDEPEQE